MYVPLSHPSGRCPVRLRPGQGGDRRSGADHPLLRAGPSPQRRVLRQGLPRRDDGGVLRRSRLGLLVPGRCAPEHRLRQHEAGGGEDPGRRPASAYPRLLGASCPTTCSRTGSAVPAEGTRARWKGWWDMRVGTSWCPVPSFPSFDALNAYLEERCLERLGRQLRGHEETIGRRMERDLEALLPLSGRALRRQRQAREPCQLPVPGAVPDQRLFGARGLRSQGGGGEGLCWRGGDQLRGRGDSPASGGPTNATTSSSTPSTTCRCWSARREPWTRPLRWPGGSCRRSSECCADCWSPGWAVAARGSSCRCYG